MFPYNEDEISWLSGKQILDSSITPYTPGYYNTLLISLQEGSTFSNLLSRFSKCVFLCVEVHDRALRALAI